MHKISITQHKEFKKIKVVPNDNLCINFKENNSRQYKEYENILNQTIPVAVLEKGISDKINNEFYIVDDFVLLNKVALKKVISTYNLFNKNYYKECNNIVIGNYLKNPNIIKQRTLMYTLLILSNTFVWIKNIHEY